MCIDLNGLAVAPAVDLVAQHFGAQPWLGGIKEQPPALHSIRIPVRETEFMIGMNRDRRFHGDAFELIVGDP